MVRPVSVCYCTPITQCHLPPISSRHHRRHTTSLTNCCLRMTSLHAVLCKGNAIYAHLRPIPSLSPASPSHLPLCSFFFYLYPPTTINAACCFKQTFDICTDWLQDLINAHMMYSAGVQDVFVHETRMCECAAVLRYCRRASPNVTEVATLALLSLSSRCCC